MSHLCSSHCKTRNHELTASYSTLSSEGNKAGEGDIVSNTVLTKNISAFTHVLIINVISTDSTYLFILTVNADPKTEKYSANEKFICIKIQCNTRHKILSNCTRKILLNTCFDYLLEMRWGKNLLNMTAWKWTKRSDVVLSHWPIFTNSFNYLDIILLILKIRSTPHIILNTFTFFSLSSFNI